MKKLAVICLTLLGLSSVNTALSQQLRESRLTVIADSATKEVALTLADLGMTTVGQTECVNGKGVINTVLPRTTFYNLSIDTKYVCSLYLTPGDNIRVTVSGGELKFEGQGASQNQFLQKFNDIQQSIAEKYPTDFKNPDTYIDNTLIRCDKVDEYIDGENLDDKQFATSLKLEHRIKNYHSILLLRGMMKSILGVNVDIAPEKYAFLRNVRFDLPQYYNVSIIQTYLKMHFRMVEYLGFMEVKDMFVLDDRAKYIASPELREEYILASLEDELYGYNQDLVKMISKVEQFVKTDDGKAKILDIKKNQVTKQLQYSSLNRGQKAFNFKANDIYGNPHRLSDYKGNLIVIDVWSTNCIPCLQEMPYLAELEQRFEGKPVVFISYSQDTDVERWKRYLEKESLHGVMLIDTLAKKSEMRINYMIKSTPRFIVVDQKGRIIDAFAPKPSDPRLELLIRQNLKK